MKSHRSQLVLPTLPLGNLLVVVDDVGGPGHAPPGHLEPLLPQPPPLLAQVGVVEVNQQHNPLGVALVNHLTSYFRFVLEIYIFQIKCRIK